VETDPKPTAIAKRIRKDFKQDSFYRRFLYREVLYREVLYRGALPI